MKLIDLIVKEVKREDIPNYTTWLMQDCDGEIKVTSSREEPERYGRVWRRNDVKVLSLGPFNLSSDWDKGTISMEDIISAYDTAEKKASELVDPEKLVDDVNHPPHYNNGGIECIDIIAEMVSDKQGMEAACVANVVKYLYRYKNKGGMESVKKAQWYLNKMIEGMENE